jgi:hypothetical protein
VHEAVPGDRSGGRDWFPYAGALGADGRRLILSCVAGPRVSPGGIGQRDASIVHGLVEPMARGFLATTGTGLIQLDRDGQLVRELQPKARKVHLMDFALDEGGSLLYVSSCGERPALHRLHLGRERLEVLPSGGLCGVPLAVHDDRLLLAATTVGKHQGYPRGPWPPEDLRLIDLSDPAAGGRPVASGVPLDALVVH